MLLLPIGLYRLSPPLAPLIKTLESVSPALSTEIQVYVRVYELLFCKFKTSEKNPLYVPALEEDSIKIPASPAASGVAVIPAFVFQLVIELLLQVNKLFKYFYFPCSIVP